MAIMITKFAIHKTSTAGAAMYFVLGAIIGVIALLVSAAKGSIMTGILFLILAPILYGAIGYLSLALICWIYNLAASGGKIGITFETKEVD